ncbi:MAG: hypothetical protein K2W96_17780 [Gemmataceae bacterium]|nr:hypothetical protein [Gemmataceae bacterium]
MPTLTLEVPQETLAELQKRAARKGRTVEEEARERLDRLDEPTAPESQAPEPPRGHEPGPVFVTEEMMAPHMVAPCMLPLAGGVPLKMEFVGPYQPDWDSVFRELEGCEG